MLYQHCQDMVQFFSHKKQEMTRRRQIMISSDVFARALLRLKTEDGISPVRFAADVGITYSTLNNIKRGRQSLSTALYKTIIAKYPKFEQYASEEMEEPGIKSGEQLELKDIFRKFDAYARELSEMRLLLEKQLRESAEREAKLANELLNIYREKQKE